MIGVGESAPELQLPDTDGTPVHLDGAALLVFLPAAFTPVCSGELAALPALALEAAGHGCRVLGISCDSMFALRTWAEQEGLAAHPVAPLLLSDFWPHGEVSRRYHAFDAERGIATRTSYLLDADRVVRWCAQAPAGQARDLRDHRDAVVHHLPKVT